LHYVEHAVLRNLTVTRAENNEYTAGVAQDGITGHITYENLTVTGYYEGLQLPRWGNNVVRGGSFNNNTLGITFWTAIFYDRRIEFTGFANPPKITLLEDLKPIIHTTADTYFVNDSLILNFGPYVNREFFFAGHKASEVPFPTARPDIPSQYVGLTNQQLWQFYGVAVGGKVVPDQAVALPFVTGGVI
jgi:hypothetical protein